jgi:hypothetical protein
MTPANIHLDDGDSVRIRRDKGHLIWKTTKAVDVQDRRTRRNNLFMLYWGLVGWLFFTLHIIGELYG